MPLVRSGFIAIPPGPQPGFDHADVYRDDSRAARLQVLETVPTERAAHTLAVDPRHHAVYAVLPASEGAAVYLDQ